MGDGDGDGDGPSRSGPKANAAATASMRTTTNTARRIGGQVCPTMAVAAAGFDPEPFTPVTEARVEPAWSSRGDRGRVYAFAQGRTEEQ
jgi:hypothetical protein